MSDTSLRVKLLLADVSEDAHIIPDLHDIPSSGDFIDVEDFITKSDYTEEQLDKIADIGGTWKVWFVTWKKDDIGPFVVVVCMDGADDDE